MTNLARPGGNATGSNFLALEVAAKRLGLLQQLVPKAARIALLVNPANATNTESVLREISEAAHALGLQIQVLNTDSIGEIDAAFAALVRERADALFISSESFFTSRRVQLATLAARNAIPTACSNQELVEAGGPMSYGIDIADTYRQVGDPDSQGSRPSSSSSSI